MNEKSKNINPWADKLQQAGFSESPDSWKAMEALLDAEIPVHKSNNYRRWVLLSILLLLLIGVCNCPALTRFNNNISQNKKVPGSPALRDSSARALRSEDGIPIKAQARSMATDSTSNRSGETEQAKNAAGVTLLTTHVTNSRSPRHQNPAEASHKGRVDQLAVAKANTKTNKLDSVKQIPFDSLNGKSQTIAKQKNRVTDSLNKKEVKNDSIEDVKGFALAIGLDQFFPVRGQDKANFNSNGNSGGISDYIPVPAARYYFHKWFYLEAEVQFNSPQYTKTLLLGQGEKSVAGQEAIQSIFVKKLFYFNLPVSVHYSPVKNLFFGGGIQFSRLTNGVALFQETNASAGFPPNIPTGSGRDSVLLSATIQNFKSDTTYKKLATTEWRFLIDVNYQWKRLTIGLRYNQALSNFVNVHVSTANTITQAHNSSLQLYLQYMLWDKRRKFVIAPK